MAADGDWCTMSSSVAPGNGSPWGLRPFRPVSHKVAPESVKLGSFPLMQFSLNPSQASLDTSGVTGAFWLKDALIKLPEGKCEPLPGGPVEPNGKGVIHNKLNESHSTEISFLRLA